MAKRRAEESGERPIVIAQVLVVGIRHARADVRRWFRAKIDGESRRPVDACERAERDALEHREDGGVQADAEREDADDGQRERRGSSRAQRIA